MTLFIKYLELRIGRSYSEWTTTDVARAACIGFMDGAFVAAVLLSLFLK